MPSGWDVYYIVFLSALMALGIPGLLLLLSYLFSRGKKNKRPSAQVAAPFKSERAGESEISAGGFNTRFFLVANAAVVLLALVLVLIPCVGTLQEGADREEAFRGLVTIVSISIFASTGLFYAVAKGDLSWLKSFQSGGKK